MAKPDAVFIDIGVYPSEAAAQLHHCHRPQPPLRDHCSQQGSR